MHSSALGRSRYWYRPEYRTTGATLLCAVFLAGCGIASAPLASDCGAAPPNGEENICYSPSAAAYAEGKVPFSPVDPSFIVAAVTGLKLTRVTVPTSIISSPNQTITAIVYEFGNARVSPDPTVLHQKPTYVTISEHASGGNWNLGATRTTQSVCDRSTCKRVLWSWEYDGMLPGEKVAFHVESDAAGKHVVLDIGKQIIASVRQGR